MHETQRVAAEILPALKTKRKGFGDVLAFDLESFDWLVLNQTEQGDIQETKIAVQKQCFTSFSNSVTGTLQEIASALRFLEFHLKINV
jgi:hypothetical protein